MQSYEIPGLDVKVSRLGYGCMNIGSGWDGRAVEAGDVGRAAALLNAAVEQGITLFDHADIYMRGTAEEAFGAALRERPELRERIIIQSKCGIRFADERGPKRYDFSYEHIVGSAEGSLRRLGIEQLDILLLHRPDPLVEPEEVARAFDHLYESGKVRAFGVSNHSATQIALIESALDQPLVVNQVELSLLHLGLIDSGVLVNNTDASYTHAADILKFCQYRKMLVQAWAPLAGGRLISPPQGADERTRAAAAAVAQIAAEHGVSGEAVALAWLLRHPAGIQPIIGTTNAQRLAACCAADQLVLTREEWYRLYVAARGRELP